MIQAAAEKEGEEYTCRKPKLSIKSIMPHTFCIRDVQENTTRI